MHICHGPWECVYSHLINMYYGYVHWSCTCRWWQSIIIMYNIYMHICHEPWKCVYSHLINMYYGYAHWSCTCRWWQIIIIMYNVITRSSHSLRFSKISIFWKIPGDQCVWIIKVSENQGMDNWGRSETSNFQRWLISVRPDHTPKFSHVTYS